jgi:mono/diheme cytochrome c family protein
MKHVLFWSLFLALLLFTLSATADRQGRAQAVFDDRCAGCHVVGWGTPLPKRPRFVDLTTSAKNHDSEWLRQWIADPLAKKPDTLCRPGGLDPVQIDLLVRFLHSRAKPISRKVVVPPRRLGPPPPEKQP